MVMYNICSNLQTFLNSR
uniref:Uncharacterized protein n=1 Tax=Anguilla anguilla TaxID=7936 RepID=A0A0E9TZQ9_ANGAN